MRNGQRVVATIRAKANNRAVVTVEAKALAWRIFDTVAACVGVAIIAGTLALVCATLRGHEPSPFHHYEEAGQ